MAALRNYKLQFEATMSTAQADQSLSQYVQRTRVGAAEAGRAWDGMSAHVRGHAEAIGAARTALEGFMEIVAARVPQLIT